VPILPGSPRFAPKDLGGLAAAAEEVGYPLLGQRRRPAAAASACAGSTRRTICSKTVEATQGLAEKSFGDGTIYLERLVEKARHVEIQVFGLGDGGRSMPMSGKCSIQRRFQKIVEESPAPGLADATRAAMCRAALALCRQDAIAAPARSSSWSTPTAAPSTSSR